MNFTMLVPNDTNINTSCIQPQSVFKGFDEMMVFLYIMIIAIAVPSNVLLIFVVRRNPSMHTFTNFMICNCACSDLLSTLIPGVLNVIDTLSTHTHGWMYGSFVCNFLYLCTYWSVSVTIISLAVIAVDRYLVIIFSSTKLTTPMLRYVIPVIWIAGFGFASPSTFVMVLRHREGVDVCEEWWPPPFSQEESPKHYTIVLFIFLYLLPLLLMTTMYVTIARKTSQIKYSCSLSKSLHQRASHREKQQKSKAKEMLSFAEMTSQYAEPETGVSSLSISNTNGYVSAASSRSAVGEQENEMVCSNTEEEPKETLKTSTTNHGNVRRKRRPRVIAMLIAIVTSFAICWFPAFLIQFLMYFDSYFIACPASMPVWAFVGGFYLHHCNSAITPLLYFGFSFSYRRGFRESITHQIIKRSMYK